MMITFSIRLNILMKDIKLQVTTNISKYIEQIPTKVSQGMWCHRYKELLHLFKMLVSKEMKICEKNYFVKSSINH